MFPPHIREMVRRGRKACLSAAKIAVLTGVSARSQRRIRHQEEFGKMPVSEFRESPSEFQEGPCGFRERRRPGRPAQLPVLCQAQIAACLAEDPRMKGAEVLRR